MADSDQGDKTEEPTPDRQRKAREEGQFARSKDAGPLAGSFVVLLTFFVYGPAMAGQLRLFAVRCLSHPNALAGGDFRHIARELGATLLFLCGPVSVLAALAAAAAGFVQAGFQPRMELAAPKLKRLDPMGKLKQMVAPQQAAASTALSLGRVLVVAIVAVGVAREKMPRLSRLAAAEIDVAVMEVVSAVSQLFLWASLALAVLAVVDFAYNAHKHHEQIKMTKQEVKEEHHQQEGDPKVKARLRQRGREIVKKGLAKEVKRADVVVANPTHVAVAIRYRAEEGVPIVTAKGFDDIAQYIKKLAREADVPVIENRLLARALASQVKPGRPIPVDLYAAVAEVLAVVFRLKRRGLTA